jgi:hypothetical protein
LVSAVSQSEVQRHIIHLSRKVAFLQTIETKERGLLNDKVSTSQELRVTAGLLEQECEGFEISTSNAIANDPVLLAWREENTHLKSVGGVCRHRTRALGEVPPKFARAVRMARLARIGAISQTLPGVSLLECGLEDQSGCVDELERLASSIEGLTAQRVVVQDTALHQIKHYKHASVQARIADVEHTRRRNRHRALQVAFDRASTMFMALAQRREDAGSDWVSEASSTELDERHRGFHPRHPSPRPSMLPAIPEPLETPPPGTPGRSSSSGSRALPHTASMVRSSITDSTPLPRSFHEFSSMLSREASMLAHRINSTAGTPSGNILSPSKPLLSESGESDALNFAVPTTRAQAELLVEQLEKKLGASEETLKAAFAESMRIKGRMRSIEFSYTTSLDRAKVLVESCRKQALAVERSLGSLTERSFLPRIDWLATIGSMAEGALGGSEWRGVMDTLLADAQRSLEAAPKEDLGKAMCCGCALVCVARLLGETEACGKLERRLREEWGIQDGPSDDTVREEHKERELQVRKLIGERTD